MSERDVMRLYVAIMSSCQFDEGCVTKKAAEVMKKAMDATVKGEANTTLRDLRKVAEQFVKLVDLLYAYFYEEGWRWWE